MIKFYKVEKSNTLLVVDTVKLQVAPFMLKDKPTCDLNAMVKWWGGCEINSYATLNLEELIEYIIEGMVEIK